MYMMHFYARHPDFALALKEQLLADDNSLNIGLNQPYDISDEEDYTIPVFGEKMGNPHVLIEIRQDLIDVNTTRTRWVERLTRAFQDLKEIN
jgi:predicted N-formylglutamate amidohydrolase